MKVGDPSTLQLRLATIYGVALRYATYAAFLADGWSLEATILGSAVTLTVSGLIPDPAAVAANFDGSHLLSYTVPGPGIVLIKAVNPNKLYLSAYDAQLDVSIADLDSLAAQINSGVGTIISGGIATAVNDIQYTEGDGLQASFTVPASALKVLNVGGSAVVSFATLADIAATPWTIAAQARYTTENGELPSNPVAFSFSAVITDKVNNVVAIGWLAPPAGAQIDDLLPSVPTVTVAGGLITGATGGTGGHIYTGRTVTVTLSGGSPTTAGTLTAVVDTNGRITGYTVATPGSGYGSAPTAALSVNSDGTVATRPFAFDIQLVPPTGSGYSAAKLSVIKGNVQMGRQQTTTP